MVVGKGTSRFIIHFWYSRIRPFIQTRLATHRRERAGPPPSSAYLFLTRLKAHLFSAPGRRFKIFIQLRFSCNLTSTQLTTDWPTTLSAYWPSYINHILPNLALVLNWNSQLCRCPCPLLFTSFCSLCNFFFLVYVYGQLVLHSEVLLYIANV